MIILDCYEYKRGEAKWYTNLRRYHNDLPVDWEAVAKMYGATISWYADEDDDCGVYSTYKTGMYFEFVEDTDAEWFLLKWS